METLNTQTFEQFLEQIQEYAEYVKALDCSDAAKLSVYKGFLQNVLGFTHDVLNSIDWTDAEK